MKFIYSIKQRFSFKFKLKIEKKEKEENLKSEVDTLKNLNKNLNEKSNVK